MTWTRALAVLRWRTHRTRDVRRVTLAAGLATGAGREYKVGGLYMPGTDSPGTVTRITAGGGWYTVHSDEGGWLFLAAHYVAGEQP
jgi:hypothetical protein